MKKPGTKRYRADYLLRRGKVPRRAEIACPIDAPEVRRLHWILDAMHQGSVKARVAQADGATAKSLGHMNRSECRSGS